MLPLSSNSRQVLDIIRRRGPITRAAISAEMNLAQQSVHRLIEDLLERGLLRAGERVKARGQPSPRMELVGEAAYTLGISINTDAAVICLTDLTCTLREQVSMRMPPLSREATLDAMEELIGPLLARNGVQHTQLVGLGVAIAGYFIENHALNAPEPLRDWSLEPLSPMLEKRFGLPVWLENNATTAAIGESLLGVGTWARNFIYLSFNYGLGAGIVIDGKPYFGSHGNAGEITLFDMVEATDRPALRLLIEMLQAEGIRVESVEDLHSRFDEHWPGVEGWLARVQPSLDRLVNTLAGLFDPQAIVFGGQLPASLGHRLIASTHFWGAPYRYGASPPRPQLLLSETQGDAAAIGAALVPLKELFFL